MSRRCLCVIPLAAMVAIIVALPGSANFPTFPGCNRDMAVTYLTSFPRTLSIEATFDLTSIIKAFKEMQVSGNEVLKYASSKITTLKAMEFDPNLLNLNEYPLLANKLIKKISATGAANWIKACYKSFDSQSISGLGHGLDVDNLETLEDMKAVLQKMNITNQVVALTATPAGFVSSSSGQIIGSYPATDTYDKVKSHAFFNFDSANVIISAAVDTTEYDCLCVAEAPLQATPEGQKIVLTQLNEIVHDINMLLTHIENNIFKNFQKLPASVPSSNPIKISPPSNLIRAHEILKSGAKSVFWEKLADFERENLLKLHPLIPSIISQFRVNPDGTEIILSYEGQKMVKDLAKLPHSTKIIPQAVILPIGRQENQMMGSLGFLTNTSMESYTLYSLHSFLSADEQVIDQHFLVLNQHGDAGTLRTTDSIQECLSTKRAIDCQKASPLDI